MTIQSFTELYPIMKAQEEEGKKIELKYVYEPDKAFRYVGKISFNCEEFVYRIKPEIYECWINTYENMANYAYESEDIAIASATPNASRVAVHMREVV